MNLSLAILGGLALAACVVPVVVKAAPAEAIVSAWSGTTWHGERAYELVTAQWRAVVSVERGRLVHFGPAEAGARNLMLETATRADRMGWSGHRVWLGPQSLWVWPPPNAWEFSAAESVKVSGNRIELLMPDAGDGYPRLTRIYEPAGDRLACRVAVAAGGTRAVQVIQILQTPPDTKVALRPAPSAKWPRGYFRVGGAVGPNMQPDLPLPAGVEEVAGGVVMSMAGKSDKLAFPPQTLVARIGGYRLALAFGESHGPETAAPDDGFYTQVYIGNPQGPVVEIEQLSPQWQAGAPGEFSMYVSLAKAE
jgi:hypothetical protein